MNLTKFNELVEDFTSIGDKNNEPLKMHALLIKQEEETYLHNFQGESKASDVRSISKTILTVALGRVITLADAGEYPAISEESKIYPMIKDAINLENEDNLEKIQGIKIKHLITHTIGYEDVLLMRNDIKDKNPFDLLDYLVNYPIIHEPGEYYLYSNAGFYLLSVVLEEFLKEDLRSFLKREFFGPLGIEQFEWEKYGKYLAGASRLRLFPEDLLKFGELFLNNGEADGLQLISEAWIQKMLTVSTYTKELDLSERTFRRYAYGHGIWLAKDSFYFGHGTDGQRLIILPKEETIILTLAEQIDVDPIDEIINKLIESDI